MEPSESSVSPTTTGERPPFPRALTGPAFTQDDLMLHTNDFVDASADATHQFGSRSFIQARSSFMPLVRRLQERSHFSPYKRPSNAKELSTSLISLVLPLDLRSTQRNLSALQERVRKLESQPRKDAAHCASLEQASQRLSEELRIVQNICAGTGPDLSRTLGVEVHQEKLRQTGEEMIAKVASHNEAVKEQRDLIEATSAEIQELKTKLRQLESGILSPSPTGAFPGSGRGPEFEGEAALQAEKNSGDEPIAENDKAQDKHDSKCKVVRLEEDVSTASESENWQQCNIPAADVIMESIDVELPPTREKQQDETSTPERKLANLGTPPHERRVLRSTPARSSKTGAFLETKPREQQRITEHNHTVKQAQSRQRSVSEADSKKPAGVIEHSVSSMKQQGGRARREAFTRYTNRVDVAFRANKPRSAQAHKNFLWEYIDNMEDKEMSAVLQSYMCEVFPRTVVKSKGRGKPHRQIILNGPLEWPELLGAIKRMPIPRIFNNVA